MPSVLTRSSRCVNSVCMRLVNADMDPFGAMVRKNACLVSAALSTLNLPLLFREAAGFLPITEALMTCVGGVHPTSHHCGELVLDAPPWSLVPEGWVPSGVRAVPRGADRDSFRGIPLVPVSFYLCLICLPGGLSSYCFAYTLLGLDGLGRALGNHGFPGVVDSM